MSELSVFLLLQFVMMAIFVSRVWADINAIFERQKPGYTLSEAFIASKSVRNMPATQYVFCNSVCARDTSCNVILFQPATQKCFFFNTFVPISADYLKEDKVKVYKKMVIEPPSAVTALDGVSYFYPANDSTPIQVWMKNGWVVFMNRNNGYASFATTWTNYVNGFGTVNANETVPQWLGLEKLYKIIGGVTGWQLRIEGYNPGNASFTAYEFENFYLDSSTYKYTVHVSTQIYGPAIDLQTHFNGRTFKTTDNTNGSTCPTTYGNVGWWYGSCYNVCLTCMTPQLTVNFASGNIKMMVRKKPV